MNTHVDSPRRQAVALTLAVAVYFALNLAATWSGRHLLSVLALLVLGSALLWPAMARRRRGARLGWLLLVAVLAGAVAMGAVTALLDSVAVLINAVVGWAFARSLRAGCEPLITQLVRRISTPEHMQVPGVMAYTRGLTRVWAVVMWAQVIVLLAAWLLLYAGLPMQPSAAMAAWLEGYLRYGSYIIIVLLFVLEYPWRRHRLPGLPTESFVSTTRRVVAGWRQMMHDGSA